jgi:hypothetical protein
MKFHRTAQFMHVPPDLTTATLFKYMALRLLFPLHSWHYVETESTLGGIGGKWLFEGNGRDITTELCRISSGQWMRLTEWNWPECQDAPHGFDTFHVSTCCSWACVMCQVSCVKCHVSCEHPFCLLFTVKSLVFAWNFRLLQTHNVTKTWNKIPAKISDFTVF